MRFLVAILILVCLQPARAQETSDWNLTQCLFYALENSPTKARVQLQQNVSKYELKAQKSKFLPQVNAYARYFNYLDVPTQIFPEEEGAILSGGTAEGPYPVRIGQKFNLFTGVSFSQVLFDGQWLLTKNYTENITAINELKMDKVENELVHKVASSYFEIITLQEQKKLLEDNLDRLQKLGKILEVQYENDLVKRTEVDRIEVQVNNLASQRQKIQSGIDAKLNLLKYLIGLPLEDTLILATPQLDIMDTSLDSLDMGAFTEIQLIERQKELKELQARSLKTGSYPTVNAFGDFQVQAQRNSFNFLDTNQPWFPAHIVGVNINLPILRGFEKKINLQKADVELAETELMGDQSKTQLEMQYLNAKAQLDYQYGNISMQIKNRDLARKIYSQSEELYQEGLATLTDLLQAESTLREANHYYAQAVLDAQVSYLDFLKATGQLEQLLQP